MKIVGNLCLLGHSQRKLLFDNQLAHDSRAPCTRVAYNAALPYVSAGSYSHGAKDQTSIDV